MRTLVVVLLAAAVAAAVAGPAPEPGPAPGPEPGPAPEPAPGSGAPNSAASDQDGQASEAVSKRGAARLSAVSGNSIVDNTVSSAPPPQQQQLQLQQLQQLQATPAQQPLSYSLQQQQPQQQPLYAPHPYSFVSPQYPFQYQHALPALPPLAMLHSKYQAPGKQHVLQYVPQPYFQVPQFQAPLMYIIPQPHHAHQAHQAQHQPGSQQPAGQPEQQQQQPQQPHYVMLLSAPAGPAAPAAASAVPSAVPSAAGFQYFGHPQLQLQQQQPFITFYAGPSQQQQQLQQHQQQHQPQQHHHLQLQPQTRFYPEQQQLVFQSQQPEGPSPQGDGPPHFVAKQQGQGLQGPVGLEAPAPPGPPASAYGSRVQPQQHAYKTIIKA